MGVNNNVNVESESTYLDHGMTKEEGVRKASSGGPSESQLSSPAVGRENIADALPPHDSYEGKHRWDPEATWNAEEEAVVVRKTDIYLLSWICLMASNLKSTKIT